MTGKPVNSFLFLVIKSPHMQILPLTGEWTFRHLPTGDWLTASVPGCVHLDLLRLGKIPDPFYADQELQAQWVAASDWEYCRKFTLDPGIFSGHRLFLSCDGLDTLAEVRLNGRLLGRTDNMFRPYRWEIGLQLLSGENELSITFHSPISAAAALQAKAPLIGGSESLAGHTYLRKAAYQFGWDWAPTLPTLGVWRDVRIEGYRDARFRDIHLRQEHLPEGVMISAVATLERWGSQSLKVEMTITAPDGSTLRTGAAALESRISLSQRVEKPELWWPNGYGGQPLYKVDLRLEGDEILDQREFTLGLRQLELRQEPDQNGRSFTFMVNGLPIFAKGSNWVPPDVFPSRVTPDRLEVLIASAAAAHQNMLRIWGGGYYEENAFYELCDRYGILVWHDFMFACGIYPFTDPAFQDNVTTEITAAIRRLRHHACLALWCGNNEMEWGWVSWGWDRPENQELKAAYERFFYTVLPEICAREDPDHPYWPSSPSSGVPFDDPNGVRQGDAHYWDVWHGRLPFNAYKTQYPRFMSEFGFQSLPPLATVSEYAPTSAWNLTSYIMDFHQRSPVGNGLIASQLANLFQIPSDFPSMVYLSMVLQAEGIRMGVEHWRRHNDRVSGTLYWQLNDTWPGSSWSSIDYYGRWKALHYAACRFFAPVLLSADVVGRSVDLYLINDQPSPCEGRMEWSLETISGKTIQSDQQEVSITPLSRQCLLHLDFSDPCDQENERKLVFVYRLFVADSLLSQSVLPFVPDKHLRLEDPALFAITRQNGDQLEVELTACSLARFVELSFEDADVIFSDNYFDLPAGHSRIITCPLPPSWDLNHARASLRLRSLYDSFH